MNRHRLTVLRDFLTTVPEPRFVMTRWFENAESEDRLNDCGFAGCAAGWATRIPEFRDAGLVRVGHFIGLRDNPDLTVWQAIRKFFDLTFRQVDYLFDPVTYGSRDGDGRITTGMVIARIDELLRTNEKAATTYTENGT